MPKIIKNTIRKVKFGKNVQLIEPVNLFECQIGDSSFVGPFVEIGKNALIGKNTRISSHSYICEMVKIGNNCFISHGVVFTNDLFKSGRISKNKKDWKPTIVEDEVVIGSNATILPVRIVKGCVIGAGSVVTKNLNKKGIYAGNPAKFLRKIK